MKTIATINFKGGVGKTTATWALCQVAAQEAGVNTLMFDLYKIRDTSHKKFEKFGTLPSLSS